MDNLPLSPRTALIFTGGFCDISLLTPEELQADLIIAADAGQLNAKKCGILPHLIVGDFDSSPLPEDNGFSRIVRVPSEKDDTDTMLACSLAIEQGVHEIRILGGTGGRIDHSLSNLFLLENLRGRGVRAVLCDGANRVQLLRDESAELVRSSYRYFSLFALEDASVTIAGCKYPLTDAPLVRTIPYAVSNEITADTAKISVSGGPVFLIESGNAPTA